MAELNDQKQQKRLRPTLHYQNTLPSSWYTPPLLKIYPVSLKFKAFLPNCKTIVNSLISGINKVIAVPFKTINGLLNTIRNASFLGISPFKGLWEQNPLPVPKIPKLEKGGILKKGQVGFLEGNGAEAVVPLDRNKYWIKAVAKEFDRNVPQTVTNNREQTINFYQKAESPAEISRMLRLEKQRGLIG